MSDLLVEVDEALKQERIERLWKQYGGFFIGFLLTIILGTAANAGYHNWKTTKEQAQSTLYLNVASEEDKTTAELLNVATTLDSGLKGLAEFQAAGIMLNSDKEKALEIYTRIENAPSINNSIKQAAFYVNTNQSEHFTPEQKLERLKTIYTNKMNPWSDHAHLNAALINANKIGNYTQARVHLSIIINNNDAIETIRKKALSIDILYALKEKI